MGSFGHLMSLLDLDQICIHLLFDWNTLLCYYILLYIFLYVFYVFTSQFRFDRLVMRQSM